MRPTMTDKRYVYRWGNNPRRAALKGLVCRVIVWGGQNSACVEFTDGQREVVSRNALRIMRQKMTE